MPFKTFKVGLFCNPLKTSACFFQQKPSQYLSAHHYLPYHKEKHEWPRRICVAKKVTHLKYNTSSTQVGSNVLSSAWTCPKRAGVAHPRDYTSHTIGGTCLACLKALEESVLLKNIPKKCLSDLYCSVPTVHINHFIPIMGDEFLLKKMSTNPRHVWVIYPGDYNCTPSQAHQ